ncbi:hypothetical protein LY76DRAFT_267052 [Colletotrichum caudatum]|nr:hypothetical protein LY76DRAFT_267052 [Colletotrichum caudatum]
MYQRPEHDDEAMFAMPACLPALLFWVCVSGWWCPSRDGRVQQIRSNAGRPGRSCHVPAHHLSETPQYRIRLQLALLLYLCPLPPHLNFPSLLFTFTTFLGSSSNIPFLPLLEAQLRVLLFFSRSLGFSVPSLSNWLGCIHSFDYAS